MAGAIETDLAVIGLGGIGSATAFFAATSGMRVIGFERFELGGHARGASHDHSRIIRRSYHTEDYVRLAAAAYDAWREVEAASGDRCLWTTGGVDLFPAGAAIDATTYTAAMEAAGVPFDRLTGADVRRRWPSIEVGDDIVALYQADTGIVSPDRSVPSLQRLATERGADLRGRSRVRELRPLDAGVELSVEGLDVPVRAATVVVAADAWTNDVLASVDLQLPLAVLQEQVSYYHVADPGPFALGRLPVWIWMDEPSFYGFPVFGRAGVKIAQDCGGQAVTGDTRRFAADPAILSRTDAFARTFFGGRLGPAAHTATCLYTLTPDRNFVLGPVPGQPRVIVALGAAHGYKFAAWFGRTLAALAAGRQPDDDLAPFAVDRPALAAPTGVVSWLV
ncbi:MAG TPA: N-methyl-L-tryptophan oxidase [Acidimicrobiales bacterium]|nr:N-methyl-L-tryptophan oxidase [Acidimicrobiales bacterium]